MVSDKTIKLKKKIFDEIQAVLVDKQWSLSNVFEAVDNDQSYAIDAEELYAAFKGMMLDVSRMEAQ